ncbi:MAG: LEPR-XLL domain-containing protein, partial [Verrucomicrobiota bacterium]
MGTDQSKNRGASKRTLKKGLHFEALEPRVLFDATGGSSAPTAEVSVSTGTLTANEDQLINDNIQFNLVFDNNGGQEGYAPYIDFLALPEMVIQSVQGFGENLSNPSGSGIQPIGVVAADGQLVDITSGTPIDHPLYGDSIGSPASDFYGGAGSGTAPVQYDLSFVGHYVYSVELPFGSYTPGNPPAEITVEASLDEADGIVANSTYNLHARGAFALGCDALDNPGTVTTPDDEPVFGDFASSAVIPQVVSLIKSAGVAEREGQFTGENASGPNFPITYRLAVDVAEGETVNNLRLTDILPDDLAYIGNLSVTNGSGGSVSFSIISEPQVATDDIN